MRFFSFPPPPPPRGGGRRNRSISHVWNILHVRMGPGGREEMRFFLRPPAAPECEALASRQARSNAVPILHGAGQPGRRAKSEFQRPAHWPFPQPGPWGPFRSSGLWADAPGRRDWRLQLKRLSCDLSNLSTAKLIGRPPGRRLVRGARVAAERPGVFWKAGSRRSLPQLAHGRPLRLNSAGLGLKEYVRKCV